MSLPVRFATCYLALFTGERTSQFLYSEICLTNSHKHVFAFEKSVL